MYDFCKYTIPGKLEGGRKDLYSNVLIDGSHLADIATSIFCEV